MTAAERSAELAPDFETHGIRREQRFPRGTGCFTHGKRGRDEGGARMSVHVGMHVVEIQCMPENAVDEGRFSHGGTDMRAPDRGLPLRAEVANVAQRDLAHLVEPAHQCHAQRVDQGIARRIHDLPRHVRCAGVDDELCQTLRKHGSLPVNGETLSFYDTRKDYRRRSIVCRYNQIETCHAIPIARCHAGDAGLRWSLQRWSC